MKPTISIGRYIGTQVAILITALIIIYSLTVSEVYRWGLYDTTHYFLSLKAEEVAHDLKQTGHLPSEPNAYTHYYLDPSQLEEPFRSAFPVEEHQAGELLVRDVEGDTLYLMPFQHPETSQLFYVSHTYKPGEDFYDEGIGISELLLLLGLCSLIIVGFLVKNIAWSIIHPVRSLESWASSITSGTGERVAANRAPLKFSELQAVAERLEKSVSAIESHNQREKRFLRTLSHELRTPLAINQAALDLFEKNPAGLESSHLKKLARMRRANNNMLSTTECLLWLWAGKERPFTKEPVYLEALVQEIVSMNTYLLKRKPVDLEVRIPQSTVVCVERKLLEMVIGNLIRNAFQYTGQGTIRVFSNRNEIIICNPVFEQTGLDQDAASIPSNTSDYGYGVGLYLVETLCAQKSWPLNVTCDEQQFSVCITLPES